jgi:putative ABC transport system permease protein
MSSEILQIEWWQLALCLLFVLIAGTASMIHGLGLERNLLVGAVRTFAQLFLLGWVLEFLFDYDRFWSIGLFFLVMVGFAAWTIRSRTGEKQVSFFPQVFLSMILTYALVTFLVAGVIVGARPWWTPQYFIPLAGMIVGNSMNAIAIALERLLSELRRDRAAVEMKLSLGATYGEASRSAVVGAMRAGMIPSINAMMAAGVVFIPGMMTGQILSGVDPVTAVRYQIVVMLMLVGSTALGTLLVVLWVRRRCFTSAHQLILRPR